MFLRIPISIVLIFGVVAGVALLPGTAAAQTRGYSQRLFALQQQNSFQQQQSAVQNAVQQTAILVQTAQQQNSMAASNSMSSMNTMSTPSSMSTATSMPTVMVLQTPIAFQQQQMALEAALQQTRFLLLNSQQKNPAVTRTELGQINTLQSVLQESIALQTSYLGRGNVFTPAQLLQLFQEQSRLSSLLTTQPAAVATTLGTGVKVR